MNLGIASGLAFSSLTQSLPEAFLKSHMWEKTEVKLQRNRQTDIDKSTLFLQIENEINEMKKSGFWQNPETRFEFWVNANSRLRKYLCLHSFAGSFFEVGRKRFRRIMFQRHFML